jgi:hypothetical protein
MKAIIVAILVLLLLPSAVGAWPLTRYRFETVTYQQAEPALVSAYWLNRTNVTPSYQKVRYQPRQWQTGFVAPDAAWGTWNVTSAGVGAGCDFYSSLNEGLFRQSNAANTHEVLLNRASRVYIVGREPAANLPTWMTALPLAGSVNAYNPTNNFTRTWNVYRADIQAGSTFFGGSWSTGVTPTGGRNMPWFIFCESDGTPSPTPIVPIGQDVPAPNQPCPQWVHDLAVTTGPDGQTYATWHPQIDPVYWCYYGHEHGSDPDWLDTDLPAFEFVAQQHGMTEGHPGFKVYVVDTLDGLYRLRVVHHFGTAGQARACNRFHTFEIRARRISDNALVADLRFMADFGAAMNTDAPHHVFQPASCPNQGNVAPSNGNRKMPVAPSGTQYEPWTPDFTATILGLTGSFGINTPPITGCADVECSSVVLMGTPNILGYGSGAERFISSGNIAIAYVAGRAENFCTNPLATAVVPCSNADAVPQLVKAGLVMTSPISTTGLQCVEIRQWGQPFTCEQTRKYSSEKEDSIPVGGPN